MQLSNEEVAKIAFRVATKNLDGIDLPEDFPIKIVRDHAGVMATWPDGFMDLVEQVRKEK